MTRLVVAVVLTCLCACNREPPHAPSSAPIRTSPLGPTAQQSANDLMPCSERLRPFVDAIWGIPLRPLKVGREAVVTIVEQTYELQESQSPFKLGETKSYAVPSGVALDEVIAGLRARAGAPDGKVIPNPREASDSDVEKTLRLFADPTTTVHCVLTLDEGDVEHVLGVAFGRSSGAVRLLYSN